MSSPFDQLVAARGGSALTLRPPGSVLGGGMGELITNPGGVSSLASQLFQVRGTPFGPLAPTSLGDRAVSSRSNCPMTCPRPSRMRMPRCNTRAS